MEILYFKKGKFPPKKMWIFHKYCSLMFIQYSKDEKAVLFAVIDFISWNVIVICLFNQDS